MESIKSRLTHFMIVKMTYRMISRNSSPIAGMPKLNEIVFFHKQSNTLFVTDLCFNVLSDSSVGGWLLYHIFGTYQRFAMSKILIKFVTDQAAFQTSLVTLFACDFENIVVSHGCVIKGDGVSTHMLRLAFDRFNYAHRISNPILSLNFCPQISGKLTHPLICHRLIDRPCQIIYC